MTPLKIQDSPVYTRIVRALGPAAPAAPREAARMLLRALDRQGVAVDDDARARVLACTDTDALERAFDRALGAATLADVTRRLG